MVALSELYSAAEAHNLGLATEVVDDVQLEARVLELARRFVDAVPLALRAVKFMMRRGLESTLDSALGDARQAALWGGPSADAIEGKTAFLERRPPRFRGQ